MSASTDGAVEGVQQFAGRNVLVTGGGTGIGRATAALLASRGARVVITGRREQQLLDTAAAINETATGEVLPVAGDVTDDADLTRLFERVRSDLGSLDALVANAGGGGFAPFGTYDEDSFYERFDINVKAVALTAQRSAELMPPGSSIVIVGSISGTMGLRGLGLYGASKAAVRSFARTWSNDLRDKQIRVNVVSPGHVYTEAQMDAGIPESAYDGVLPFIPAGRLGRPEEIATVICFLASPESSYVAGAEFVVDGGLTQVGPPGL